MNSTGLKTNFGTLTGSRAAWSAELTEDGSSAISAISYENNTIVVTFRNGREYEYAADEATVNSFYDELIEVMDGQGSIGKLVSQALRNNQLQLV